MKKWGIVLSIFLLAVTLAGRTSAVGFDNQKVGEVALEVVKILKCPDYQNQTEYLMCASLVKDRPDLAYKRLLDSYTAQVGRALSVKDLPSGQRELIAKWQPLIEEMMNYIVAPTMAYYTAAPSRLKNLQSKLPPSPTELKKFIGGLIELNNQSAEFAGDFDSVISPDDAATYFLQLFVMGTAWLALDASKAQPFFDCSKSYLDKLETDDEKIEFAGLLGGMCGFVNKQFSQDCFSYARKLIEKQTAKDSEGASDNRANLRLMQYLSDLNCASYKSQLSIIGISSLQHMSLTALKFSPTPENAEAVKKMLPQTLEFAKAKKVAELEVVIMAAMMFAQNGLDADVDKIVAAAKATPGVDEEMQAEAIMSCAIDATIYPKGQSMFCDQIKKNSGNFQLLRSLLQQLSILRDDPLSDSSVKEIEAAIRSITDRPFRGVLLDSMSYTLPVKQRNRLRKDADSDVNTIVEVIDYGKDVPQSKALDDLIEEDRSTLISLYIAEAVNAAGFDTPRAKEILSKASGLMKDYIDDERASMCEDVLGALEEKMVGAPAQSDFELTFDSLMQQ